MMNEKRFTCEVTDTDLCHIETITDNFEMNTFDDVETVTELLNKFSEENKELKEKIQLLQSELNADAKQYKIFIDIIDEADDLIMSHLSKHYQRKWRSFCKNKEYDF